MSEQDQPEESETLRQQLEAARHELQHFVYSISHDLQSPLRGLVNFSHLLMRDYSEKLDERAKHYLGFIIGGGEKAQAMLDGLLQYSRITTQAKPLARVDSAHTLKRALHEMQEEIDKKRARIDVGALPPVNADEDQLLMLFKALIANALVYNPAGEVPFAAVSASAKDGMQEFRVRDHGIGIPPEYHGRIFELFKRLHLDTEYPGIGMGLTLAKKIVERHGGKLRVISEDKGTSFYFTLPTAEN